MQKPTGGVQRLSDDQRSTRDNAAATPLLTRLSSRAMRAFRAGLRGRAVAAGSAIAATARPFTRPERALPLAVSAIVAVAALLAFLPSTPQGAVGGVQGRGTDVRIAVNGGIERIAPAEPADAGAARGAGIGTDDGDPATADAPATGEGLADPEAEVYAVPAAPDPRDDPSFVAVTIPSAATPAPVSDEAALEAPVTDDGTILAGYAPLTTVEDGADLIRTYKVKKGDTLASVAKKFDVSKTTLWWANKLSSKELKVGKTLRIPPVSGAVYTVKATDTLEALAKKYKIKEEKVLELNGLTDPTLVVGQVLVLPGAKLAPMPTPKPVVTTSNVASSGGVGPGLGGKYTGGAFRWPVIGGGNYISQYYHYGHYGVDIAADRGSKVVAAASGKVTFAGWKSNGGGYQVWISHGGGLYTTYSHMSGVSVGRGQSVGKGDQVGRVGSSGYATGPHLHFEVWKGPVWDGGSRVNPMGYL